MEAFNQNPTPENHNVTPEQQKWDLFGVLAYTDLPKGKLWTMTELMLLAQTRLTEKGQEQAEVPDKFDKLDKPAMGQQAEHEALKQVNEQETADKDWCHDENLQPFAHKNFWFLLAAKGLTKVRKEAGYIYQGVSVMAEE